MSLWAAQGFASGLALDQGAAGMGSAWAGAAATASDPTTLYYNPAGMSLLKGDQAALSVTYLDLQGQYKDSGRSTDAEGMPLTGDNGGGNFGKSATIPNLYYVHNSGSFAYGLGISTPFGLSLAYDAGWKGRFSATKASLQDIEIAPAASYAVTNDLSIGVSVGYQMLSADLGAQINDDEACVGAAMQQGIKRDQASAYCLQHGQYGQESSVDLKGTSSAVGFGVGALYKLSSETNLGLNYRSAVHHSVTGTAKFTNAAFFNAQNAFTNSKFKSSLTLPASMSLAAAHTSGALSLMADVTRTNWSSFKQLKYTYADNTPATVVNLNWRDTTRVGLGGAYKVTPQVPIRIGLAYDEGPVANASDRDPALPDGDRKVVALGTGYESGSYKVDVGFSDALLANGPTDTTSGTGDHLVGTYQNASIMTVGAQFGYIW